tara:strand:- start:96 stop:341 length:246 start_codon:yes stop_codon:yes gene_type:complete
MKVVHYFTMVVGRILTALPLWCIAGALVAIAYTLVTMKRESDYQLLVLEQSVAQCESFGVELEQLHTEMVTGNLIEGLVKK